MTRYRLRTLMFLITAVCVFLGWAAYVRQMEKFHREEASKAVSDIVAAEENYWTRMSRDRREYVTMRIEALVSDGTQKSNRLTIRRQDIPGSEDIVIYNGRGLSTRGRGDIEQWRSAVHHRVMADRYRWAMFCPWLLLINDSAP